MIKQIYYLLPYIIIAEICAMSEDSGNCLAFQRKWRYNSLAGECVEFSYGGCGGNKNNFDSKEACDRFCNRRGKIAAF